MTRLYWLAQVARDAGLTVVEVDGWQERGAATMSERPRALIAHHTGTAATWGGDYPSLRIVRDGRPRTATSPGLPGPLSHYGLGRSGVVYVIASGKANHAGAGHWRDTYRSVDTIGIEAEHPGDSAPWPAAQLGAYDRLCAAVLRRVGQDYTGLCGHREWATPPGRKVDPVGIDMDAMRRRVAVLHASPPPPPRPPATRLTEVVLMASLPTLSAPSTHWNVRTLQGLLCSAASVGLCAPVPIDGDFGPRTRSSVIAYQLHLGLVADGVVGERTWRRLLDLREGTP